MHMPGDVVELVDTLGLEPSAARRGGSTPSIPTSLNKRSDVKQYFSFTCIKKNTIFRCFI